MKCKSLFSDINKKDIISLSPAEFSYSVVRLNVNYLTSRLMLYLP